MKKILFLLFSILSLSACAQTNNTTDTLTVKYIKPLSGVLNITFPDGSVQTTAQKGGTVTTFGFTNTPGISGTVTNLTTSPNLTLAVDTNSKFKTQTQARADTNKLHNEMVQLSNKNWPSGGAGFYPYNGSQGYGTQYLTSGSGDTLLLTRGGTAKNLTLTGITNFTGSIVTSVSSNNAIQGTSGNGNGIVGISTSFFGGNFSSTNGNGIIATSTTSTAAIFQSSGIYPIALFDSATIIKLSIDLHGNVLQANNHTGTITDTLINKKQARALIGSSGGGNIWPSGSARILY